MTGDSIFSLSDDGERLVEMRAAPYESEELLQRLLADFPDLLAGSQMDRAAPRRWLLIARELGVPRLEGGGGYWSLDHLFVDQDAVPTLVEVKRSSNTQIRREVIGQMLDYAANGTRYWPIDALRRAFEQRCARLDHDSTEVLAEHVGGDLTADTFWASVADHLQTGRIRMVFVADEIPPELQRIIEFLNNQMTNSDVVGVEVRQYIGEGRRTLVPRVVGLTTAAQNVKAAQPRPNYAELLAVAPVEVRDVEARLLRWAEDRSLLNRLSPAARQFSTSDGAPVLQLFPGYATVEVRLDPIRSAAGDETADQVFASLQALTSKPLARKYPGVPCADLLNRWNNGGAQALDAWLNIVIATGLDGSASFGYGA